MGLVSDLKARFERPAMDPRVLRGAKPLRNPNVVATENGTGVTLVGTAARPRGLGAIAERWMRLPPTKTFELEEVGAFVWRRCDGATTFDAISKALCKEYKMNRLEADASLSAFIQTLTQRGLVTILVKQK